MTTRKKEKQQPDIVLVPPQSEALHINLYPSSIAGGEALLDFKTIAQILGLTVPYVRNRAEAMFPIVKVPGGNRVKLSDVLKLIERSTVDRREEARAEWRAKDTRAQARAKERAEQPAGA